MNQNAKAHDKNASHSHEKRYLLAVKGSKYENLP